MSDEIDFKKCPYCQSERIDAMEENPDYMIGESAGGKELPAHYLDPYECFDCKGTWNIAYYPLSQVLDVYE